VGEPSAAVYGLCPNRHPRAARTTAVAGGLRAGYTHLDIYCPTCERDGTVGLLTLNDLMYRSYCPIEACPWTHDDVTVMWPGEAPRIEAVVRGHLETHTLLEWVQEVMRLRGLLAARDGRARKLAEVKVLVDELAAGDE
jgi:hypothetical protein